MPGPKVVIFDLGKVLVDFDYHLALRRLAPRSNLAIDGWNRLLNQSPLLLRYESGGMTSAEFYEEVRIASGFRGEFAEFSRIFGDIFEGIEPMIALHAELRSRGCRTFVFSNTNELAVRHLRERFPFFAAFDGYILSFEHGALKPDARLYEVVERTTGCRAAELLYLDDRPENVAAGLARGWQAIVHQDVGTTRERVRAAGLLEV
jgi:glucose-1-phosphatase